MENVDCFADWQNIYSDQYQSADWRLTLWRLLGFVDFRKKTPKRTWLCAGISLVRYALQTVAKDAASLLACTRKKFFAWGVWVFCE